MRPLLIAIGLAILTGPLSAEFFTIDQFDASISIAPNGTVTVTETITVDFRRARRGIFRDLPVRYQSDIGSDRYAPISVKSVTDGHGNRRPYKVLREGSEIRIRIGDPDIYVSGRQVYAITYTIENILLFLDDHDELYWNVTGNGWGTSIGRVTAEVTLELSKVVSELETACYTGGYGAREAACRADVDENSARFVSLRSLDAYEGMTIAVGWPKGAIAAPTWWDRLRYSVIPNGSWLLLFPLLALVYMWREWWTKGRDPVVQAAIAVQYRPPEEKGAPLTPALVGTLVDERFDQRDLTAAIMSLGAKGYLRIEEKKVDRLLFDATDYELTRLKQADDGLGPVEALVFAGLFAEGGDQVMISDLKKKFYTHLPGIYRAATRMLVDGGYFLRSPSSVQTMWVGVAVVSFVFLMVITFLTASLSPIYGVIAALATAGIIIGFGVVMPAKTVKGARTRNYIVGFQEFMTRADKDRIERLGPSVFYEYLPYAIALNVTDQWAEAFKDLTLEPPSWYVPIGTHQMIAPMAFAHSINQATSAFGQTVYSAPRGSGLGSSSGGGGFSGGGGGGGGGGSW